MFTLSFFLKILSIIVSFSYIIFLAVLFNQVVSMGGVIKQDDDARILKLIAIINLVLAISLFLLTVVIL